MKIGVVICTCGNTLNLDFKEIKDFTEKLVEKVEVVDLLCKNPNLESFRGFDGIVFACCSERSSLTFDENAMHRTAKAYGIKFWENANIREQCAWIHDEKTATNKAKDLIAMAVEKLKLSKEYGHFEPLKKVLVVGGGVAGISCAKSLAELGVDVTLLEEKPYLGGHACQIPFLWQGEGYASMCTSECVIPVINREILQSKTRILTNSRILDVEKVDGNFRVKIEVKPRYVDPERCISCGRCSEVCPVEIPNPFEFGMSKRRAIDKSFRLAMPDSYDIVEGCNRCGECIKVCPTNAINLNAESEVIEEDFGAIVLATGFDTNREVLKKFRYDHPKVMTLLEFERMIANNLFGDVPMSVVFVLCQKDEVGYCSRLCCPITVKQVNRLKMIRPETEVTVIYKSLRTYGRAFEAFRKLALKRGVEFVQAEVEGVEEREDYLVVKTNEGEFEADYVVLAEPLIPSSLLLVKKLGLNVDEFGFPLEFQPRVVNPGESYVDRVFLASKGFKDVQESVESGRAVAMKVYEALKGKEMKYYSVTNVDRCSKCGLCSVVCPHDAIKFDKDLGIFKIDFSFCKGCGLCYATCPSRAITLVNLEDEQILRMADVAFKNNEGPRILAFLCYWCSYAAGDLMGYYKLKLPPYRSIRVRCSASLNPDVVEKILAENKADYVLIAGCPPKNCHHIWGNYIQDRRIKLLNSLGERRVRFEYVGVAMWNKLAKVIKGIYSDLDKLHTEQAVK